jgi:hypothetical protein
VFAGPITTLAVLVTAAWLAGPVGPSVELPPVTAALAVPDASIRAEPLQADGQRYPAGVPLPAGATVTVEASGFVPGGPPVTVRAANGVKHPVGTAAANGVVRFGYRLPGATDGGVQRLIIEQAPAAEPATPSRGDLTIVVRVPPFAVLAYTVDR